MERKLRIPAWGSAFRNLEQVAFCIWAYLPEGITEMRRTELVALTRELTGLRGSQARNIVRAGEKLFWRRRRGDRELINSDDELIAYLVRHRKIRTILKTSTYEIPLAALRDRKRLRAWLSAPFQASSAKPTPLAYPARCLGRTAQTAGRYRRLLESAGALVIEKTYHEREATKDDLVEWYTRGRLPGGKFLAKRGLLRWAVVERGADTVTLSPDLWPIRAQTANKSRDKKLHRKCLSNCLLDHYREADRNPLFFGVHLKRAFKPRHKLLSRRLRDEELIEWLHQQFLETLRPGKPPLKLEKRKRKHLKDLPLLWDAKRRIWRRQDRLLQMRDYRYLNC